MLLRFVHTSKYVARSFESHPLNDKSNSVSCKPLFIIGPGRSGTTLLRSMLVAGRQIAIPPETQVLPEAIRKFVAFNLRWPDISRLIVSIFESHHLFSLWDVNLSPAYQAVMNMPMEERCLARIIDEVFICYASQKHPDAALWGDQSPINTFHLKWLIQTYPDAMFLHLLRDGRDVIASLIERGLSLENATSRWITGVESSLKLQSKIPDSQFLEIRYENLVENQELTLSEICVFLNIEYQSEMLDYWKLSTTIEHKYQDYHRNIGKPVFTMSVGSWEKRMSNHEQRYVMDKTNHLLNQLGYLHD